MGDRPISDYQIQLLANGLEYRGRDATGVALIDNAGKVVICKHHSPAWEFTASTDFKKFLAKYLTPEIRIVLVHTRAWTTGSPYKNENNHPMYAGPGGGCIVHNGMISNHDGLFTANKGRKGWKRSCETDSDAIRAFIDFHEGVDARTIEDMNKLSGVAAIAAFHPGTPDKLLLMRDSNPLVIAATPDLLAFASDKKSLHTALKPWVKMHGMLMQVHAPDIAFLPMHDQSAWIFGPNGLETHKKFSCNGYAGRGNRTYTRSCDWKAKHERAAEEANKEEKKTADAATTGSATNTEANSGTPDRTLPRYIICPGKACNRLVELEAAEREVELNYLACGDCGTNLSLGIPAWQM